jgi:iron-sulfur cluster protein
LGDTQLRTNLAHATSTIRDKRLRVVGELSDWEELRDAGASIKDYVLQHMDELLVEVERNVTRHGGVVHWARNGAEANAIVVDLVKATGETSVVKVKSMTTAETELNVALERHGITPYETDLAELIVQLGDDLPSHILVPAIHKNRSQIRDIFLDKMGESGLAAPADLTDDPTELTAAARAHLRDRFLSAKVAISGANFLIADSGGLVVVESEGNGRMCLTLPDTLISVVGVEKLLPDWQSLGVFLQLLPRSATGERMNPYTSIFTGVTEGDGPSSFHLVLLDNGRTSALAEPDGRDVLRCIRCSACMNVCPVYERTGGHAYGNPYPGPIGAVLVPQLRRGARTPLEDSLPFASTLCGACYEACPVKINIPKILVRLRSEIVDHKRETNPLGPELIAMTALAKGFSSPRLFRSAIAAGAVIAGRSKRRTLRHLPPPLNKWSATRDAPLPPTKSFRTWFRATHGDDTSTARTNDDRNHSVAGLNFFESGLPSSAPTGMRESGREAVLASIADALGGNWSGAAATGEHAYRTRGSMSANEKMERLRHRLLDYNATLSEAYPDEIAETIAALLSKRSSSSVAIPTDLPPSWLVGPEMHVYRDEPALTIKQLDAIDSTISGCAVAIAETGTIVLDSGPTQGRRALSLVPDHLIIVVREDQVVEIVPEAIARVQSDTAQTWISGPSATSDIELERVEGVHGPRRLDVVLLLDRRETQGG